MGARKGCCVGLGTSVAGFGRNLTCQTGSIQIFFSGPFFKNLISKFCQYIASEQFSHVSDGFYCMVENVSRFEHSPWKMVRRRCQTVYPSVTPTKRSGIKKILFLSDEPTKIVYRSNRFFRNRASSEREPFSQRRQVKSCSWAPKSPYLLYGTTSRRTDQVT